MTGYLIRRVLQSIVVIILVSLVTFTLLHLLPGGPARAILGPRASTAQLQQFTTQNHYDRPLIVQFGLWCNDLLHGNLGYSYHLNENVSSLIADKLPKTLVLMGLSIVFALDLPWFSPEAPQSNSLTAILADGNALVLPVTTLALITIAAFSRYTRSSVMENLTQD